MIYSSDPHVWLIGIGCTFAAIGLLALGYSIWRISEAFLEGFLKIVLWVASWIGVAVGLIVAVTFLVWMFGTLYLYWMGWNSVGV